MTDTTKLKGTYKTRSGWTLVDIVKTMVTPTGTAVFMIQLGDKLISTCRLDPRFRYIGEQQRARQR